MTGSTRISKGVVGRAAVLITTLVTVLVVLCVVLVLVLTRLMNQADVRQLIPQYGVWFYLLTFAWTFIEGE